MNANYAEICRVGNFAGDYQQVPFVQKTKNKWFLIRYSQSEQNISFTIKRNAKYVFPSDVERTQKVRSRLPDHAVCSWPSMFTKKLQILQILVPNVLIRLIHLLDVRAWVTVFILNIRTELRNSVDPDQTPHYAASDQGLYCLLKAYVVCYSSSRFRHLNELFKTWTCSKFRPSIIRS